VEGDDPGRGRDRGIDAEPSTLGPPYEAVDPDALERLLRSIRASDRRRVKGVRFTLDGHAVAVGSDGEVRVGCEPADARRSR